MKRRVHPFLFLVGYRVCRTTSESLARVIDVCRALDISFREVELVDGYADFIIPFWLFGKLKRKLESENVELSLVSSHGIPGLLLRYRHRYGFTVAVVISVLLVILSGQVIWDVRIDGERRLTEQEVREVLRECGLERGTLISSIDAGVLENRVMIFSDDIAWISVNVIGTVAEVEIRELEFTERDEEIGNASNIVASHCGKIVGFENISGSIVVEIGEEVAEGQLLISGIYGDEENGFRYTNPKGRVLAEVERSFEIEVPRVETKKSYKEGVKCEKYLIFFKKRIKFFSNYRNLPPTCDKIDIEEFLLAPSGKELPIGIFETRYLEYEYVSEVRDDETLSRIAKQRLDAVILSELADAEILRKNIEYELYEDKIVLRCKIKCIVDIAKRQEIGIG
jgi:similar to stage IV sporulation protein